MRTIKAIAMVGYAFLISLPALAAMWGAGGIAVDGNDWPEIAMGSLQNRSLDYLGQRVTACGNEGRAGGGQKIIFLRGEWVSYHAMVDERLIRTHVRDGLDCYRGRWVRVDGRSRAEVRRRPDPSPPTHALNAYYILVPESDPRNVERPTARASSRRQDAR